MPFLRLCNLCFLFLFLWSLTLSSKYWVTAVFKRAKDIIHGRKFFYSLMSQVFLTLLLYFTFLLKHTSHLMFHRVAERFQLPCLWTSFFREGEGVRWQRWECFRLHWSRRSCQQGRSDLFFPEQQVSWEFGRIQVEDFFQLSFQQKERKLPTRLHYWGVSLSLYCWGDLFSLGGLLCTCFPCPARCKDALVNRDLRSLLRHATSRRRRFGTCVYGKQAGYGLGADISFIEWLEKKQGGKGGDLVTRGLIPTLPTCAQQWVEVCSESWDVAEPGAVGATHGACSGQPHL